MSTSPGKKLIGSLIGNAIGTACSNNRTAWKVGRLFGGAGILVPFNMQRDTWVKPTTIDDIENYNDKMNELASMGFSDPDWNSRGI